MSWAGPSLPGRFFKAGEAGSVWLRADLGVREQRSRGPALRPIAKEGGLCTGPASRTECRKRAEATREPAGGGCGDSWW